MFRHGCQHPQRPFFGIRSACRFPLHGDSSTHRRSLFFAVSGFFYTKKLRENAPLLPYIRKLLATYILWSIPYFIISFIQWGYRSPVAFSLECMYSFFLVGSSYHFWFFPALFISIGITTVLWKLGGRRLLIPLSLLAYVIGCLGCSYYQVGVQIPVLAELYGTTHFTEIRRILLMGFPFFICGYTVRLINESLQHRKRTIRSLPILCTCILLWSFELHWVISQKLYSNIVISPMLYPLVTVTLLTLVRSNASIPQPAAYKCRAAANFMYYAHPLCLMLLGQLPAQITPTAQFTLTIIATFLIGIFLAGRRNKLIPYLIG